MRNHVCSSLVARAENPRMVFLTGDLGFMALEPLRERLGDRFINCGVAEQNMVTVAAALAKEGLEPWVYTIAPFCYARAFEQIRNDVCMHGLPVRLIGNGGGYGYGVMGSTHHALEDYGVLLTLPALRAYVPAFADDIPAVIARAGDGSEPCYIRLGRDERRKGCEPGYYAAWRCLQSGDGPVVLTIGPLAGSVEATLAGLEKERPEVWVVAELTGAQIDPPPALAAKIAVGGRLCVIEEHVAHGSLGSLICRWLIQTGLSVRAFRHLHALQGASDRSGSQSYLRAQAGLDPESIRHAIADLRNV